MIGGLVISRHDRAPRTRYCARSGLIAYTLGLVQPFLERFGQIARTMEYREDLQLSLRRQIEDQVILKTRHYP